MLKVCNPIVQVSNLIFFGEKFVENRTLPASKKIAISTAAIAIKNGYDFAIKLNVCSRVLS